MFKYPLGGGDLAPNFPHLGTLDRKVFFFTPRLPSKLATECLAGGFNPAEKILMEEILHHLECINPVSNGIRYKPQLVSRISSIDPVSLDPAGTLEADSSFSPVGGICDREIGWFFKCATK